MFLTLISILYIQFVNEYIFQLPRNPYFTYIITIIVFLFVIMNCLKKITKKTDGLVVLYFLCLLFAMINTSYLASANIFGFALYLRNKQYVSIKSIGRIIFVINMAVIFVLLFRIYMDNRLVKIWGEKLDKDIIVHGFNNPNTEGEFFYFCSLGIWLSTKNKYFRNVLVIIITVIAYRLTYSRSYMMASALLVIFDLFISKRLLPYYKFILISTPILVIIFSFAIGYLTKGIYQRSIDAGLAGRFYIFGYIMNRLDTFKFIFGFKNFIAERGAGVPLDVSVFAIFVTRGIVMLILMLICYIKCISTIAIYYYKYVPAILSIVIAGIALPMLAWFSINMIIFLCLLEHTRKVNNELSIYHCAHL